MAILISQLNQIFARMHKGAISTSKQVCSLQTVQFTSSIYSEAWNAKMFP